jgi:Rrf2 family protein
LDGIVKFSEASSIAMHAMAMLAARPDRHVSVREVAERLPISESHLAKVFQRLTRAGLVEGIRGPGGGFRLVPDRGELTLLDVYEAIDGPLGVSPCLFAPAKCCSDCILGDAVHRANVLVRERLAGTRLADVAPLLTGPALPWATPA